MTTKGPLKAVFFDIDDTLYSTSEFARTARTNGIDAMLALGLQYPREQLIKELSEVVAEFSSNYEHHFDKLLVRIPSSAYKDINPAILVAAAVVAYHQTKFTQLAPYPDVIKAFERLSKTPLILGVITAGLQIKQAEKLIRLGVYQYLSPSAIFISDQVGISKPNVKLYQHACSVMKVEPRCSMYVGNNLLTDIAPANQIGMITVLNTRGLKCESLREEIKPDHEIHSFDELLWIISNQYGVKCDENST